MERQGKNAYPAVKICGLRTTGDLQACLRSGVEYVGFNFFPQSKRHIEPSAARSIWQAEAGNHRETKTVGVVVNPSVLDLKRILKEFPELDVLQFHGEETPIFLKEVKALTSGKYLWKALPVRGATDITLANAYAQADLLLFDTKVSSEDPALKGGTGERFDWGLLAHVPPMLAWGLAGGLKVGNLAEAMQWKPMVIDICSGVETEPGCKDHAKIEATVAETRRMRAQAAGTI
jgi:phosphoribosylanthranilate isomerase